MYALKEKIKLMMGNRLLVGGIILVLLALVSAGIVYFTNQKAKPDVKILVAEPGSVCYLSFEVQGTAPVEGFSCNKEFRDANNNVLASDYRPKPLEKMTLAMKVMNTGNTVLSELTLEDPLNNDLSAQGAKNLDQLKYLEIKASSGSCTYDQNTKLFKCSGLNLAVGQSLDISFLVEISSTVGSSKELVNVSKVYNANKTVYCSDSITTSPISNVCNYTSGYCEQVFRDKADNETSCTSDTDCKTNTPKHLECVNESCKSVEGAGSNKCSDDNDCKTPTHSICQDKQCKEVSGEGDDECSKDSECVYKKCVNNSCTLDTCEDGDCTDECDTTADCNPSVTPGTPQPRPSISPSVPQTGSNDNNVFLSLFILAWIGSGAFFAIKAGLFNIRK